MKLFSIAQKNQKWTLVFMITIVLLLFSIALKNNFVYWDDPRYVFENELVKNPSFTNLLRIFKSVVLLNYHPITILSFWLNSFFFGMKPFSFILTNIVIHLINVFLIYRFTIQLNFQFKIALLVAFFWAIHPMHVEAVVWVSSRKDLLSTFFILLGLIQYVDDKALKSQHSFKIYLYFCLACLSKMNAICFPILLFAIDYWFGISINLKNIKSKAFFILISFVFFILAYNLLGKGNGFGIFEIIGSSQNVLESKNSILENLSFASMGLFIHLIKLFLPFQLHHWYVYPEFKNLYFCFLILPITLLFLFLKSNNKLFKFGFLFFFSSIFLVLQFVQNSKAILAERYTYLPYFGLILILIVYFEQNLKTNFKSIFYLIFSVFFGVMTFNYIKTWKTTLSLWENTFKYHPDNKDVALSLINLQNKEKDNLSAYSTCKKAIEVGLKAPEIYLVMSQIEINSKEYNDAILHLSLAQTHNVLQDSSITQTINLNKSAVFGWLGQSDSSVFYLSRFQQRLKKQQ